MGGDCQPLLGAYLGPTDLEKPLCKRWHVCTGHVQGLFGLEIALRDQLRSISAASELGGIFGGARAAATAEQMASHMMQQAFNAISPGIGLYLSVLLALYLCCVGFTRSTKR